jgi:peptide/nickel transport system permease protein
MRGFWGRYARSRSGVLGLAILTTIILIALLAPVLFPYNPFQIVDKPFLPPFGDYVLGTDSLGRNIAAGLAYGARTSLLIGVLATLLAVGSGVIVGGLAGYYGGWLDDALMRVTEFFQTIPFFVFAIVLVAILSPSVQNIIIAIAIVTWPPVARLVRGEFMAMRSRDFVSASVCLGTSDYDIIARDILPNCLSPIIVTGSLMVAHPHRVRARVPWARRPERHELGLHDCFGPHVPALGVVAVRHARHCHSTRRPVHQPGRRGP